MIEISNLYKSFKGLSVLEDASLNIRDGETLAIIGHSGSGKSVFIKHIIGLLTPDSGSVQIDGVDINALSYNELREIRQRFGVLFQGGALFDSLNSFDNVAFPLRTFTEMSEADITKRVQYCLEQVNLQNAGAKKPAELSGGMRKRIALARAIALDPQYLLYDEPTSGLDPQTSATINKLIRKLTSELNATSILVTHDMHSVLAVADRVAFIHNRTIHWSGTIQELHNATDETLLAFVRASEYQIGPAGSQHKGAHHEILE